MITSPAFAGKRYRGARAGPLGAGHGRGAARERRRGHGLGQARGSARGGRRQGARIADPLTTSLYGYDGIVVSPGVPLNRHPIAARAREARRAADRRHRAVRSGARRRCRRTRWSGSPAPTASRRRPRSSTTSSRPPGMPATMAGNIGYPILGQEPLAEGGVYVLELSSYQIDLTHSLDCDVAVLLNITPDHLDRYDGVDDYAASKARLFAMQSPDHVAVIAAEDDYTRAIAGQIAGPQGAGLLGRREGPVALAGAPGSAQRPERRRRGRGRAGARRRRRGDRARRSPPIPACRTGWSGSPRRTACCSSTTARRPIRLRPRRRWPPIPAVHWILGGLPKSDDLDACEPYLDHVRAAYTIGEAGPMFAQLLDGEGAGQRVRDADRGGRRAAEAARPGEVVLLSPACASFDQFRDYEARGDAFRAAVEALHDGRGRSSRSGRRREQPARPLRPERARPLVLGDRPGPAASSSRC